MLDIKYGSKGDSLKVDSYWLRDHCRCEKCYNARTSQRLFSLVDMPKDLKAKDVAYLKNDTLLEITCKWEKMEKTYKNHNKSQVELNVLQNHRLTKICCLSEK